MTAAADTNQHYDQDPRIFTLFLDPSHKYSSALYGSPEESLADAQQRKLHFVADRLGLRGGERLLDLGCGWGSLILFMAREYGARAVGVSPAPGSWSTSPSRPPPRASPTGSRPSSGTSRTWP